VTGTPGTGKTTFARALARAIDAKYISLAAYVNQHRLYTGVDHMRKSKIVDVKKTRSKFRKLANATSGPIIVDTHHPEGIIPNSITKAVFVLRCNPILLSARLRKRKWSLEKARENVMAEVLDYCLINAQSCYSKRKVIQLDTSRTSSRYCVTMGKKVLSGQMAYLPHIDWLTKVHKSCSLSNYLEC
jgi:broad-specificity NMP kinase